MFYNKNKLLILEQNACPRKKGKSRLLVTALAWCADTGHPCERGAGGRKNTSVLCVVCELPGASSEIRACYGPIREIALVLTPYRS